LNPKLQYLYKKLEHEREMLSINLAKLPLGKLNYSPQGKWSINQIVAHLITAERLSLLYMQKKIQGIEEADDSGIVEELKMLVLIVSQRLPLKFKAPKVVKEHTSNTDNLEQLNRDWEKVRGDLKQLLETIPDKRINRKIYKHVFAGKLNVKHALRFLREHIIHHMPQIERLSKNRVS
jgi:DinB superfamily